MRISRRQFVKAMAAMSAASMLAACGGNSGSGSSGGKKALTFQIWDVAQKEGMEAMCAAYTQQHPEVSIEVQVTSWNEYWTKLEAAATSNQMPDIFWMHTNELLKYADNGMLADCSDIVEKDKFSEISLSNAMGSNGTLYAVPKDKDTVGLVYNKEILQRLENLIPPSTAISVQEAIFSGDNARLKAQIQTLLTQSVSSFDTAGENFYHGFMLGLCALLGGAFVTSNRESGDGRYDIQLKPTQKGLPGILIELKAEKNCSDEKLKKLSETALQQINDKKYETELTTAGVRTIYKYGVAFSGKKVEVAVG